jgi:hypothetical protein
LKAVGDADYTAALTAIAAEDPTTWYWTTIESRTSADILDAAAWVEANSGENPHFLIVQENDLATLVSATALNTSDYNRTAAIYHLTDGEYLDGAWASRIAGLQVDSPRGMGITMYRRLTGVPFDVVTGAEATGIYAVECNLYGRNKGLAFTSLGTAASGRKIDIQLTTDWIKTRTEEAVLALFVGTPTKIAFDNPGINTVAATCQGQLDRGVLNAHFASAAGSSTGVGPRVVAPDKSQLDPADITARVLRLSGTAEFSGAIETLNYTLSIGFTG